MLKMRGKRIILISAVILFLVLFSLSLYFYYFHFLPQKAKYLKNLSELYSSFTDYMKEEVDYHLKLLGCQPKEYYYEGSNVCFNCKEFQPCFGFALVDMGKGKKFMNIVGSPILKFKKFTVKVADFYYDRLATKFNCKEVKKELKCDFNLRFSLENNEVKAFAEPENLKDIAKTICKELQGLEEESINCKISEYRSIPICKCGKMFIEIVGNKLRYGYYQ
jgi:hypothetical protein